MTLDDRTPAMGWHAQKGEHALAAFGVTPNGLSTEEAAARRAQYGPNRLPEPPPRGVLVRLRGQFANLLIQVLIAAGLGTAALGHWADSSVIFAVVLLNAAIGLWQEGRAETALAVVRSMLPNEASVRRDGARSRIPADDLVPGDIVLIEPATGCRRICG
ncbi:cation-transporting P-type ATPase [Limimaricola cinnabarinus]